MRMNEYTELPLVFYSVVIVEDERGNSSRTPLAFLPSARARASRAAAVTTGAIHPTTHLNTQQQKKLFVDAPNPTTDGRERWRRNNGQPQGCVCSCLRCHGNERIAGRICTRTSPPLHKLAIQATGEKQTPSTVVIITPPPPRPPCARW